MPAKRATTITTPPSPVLATAPTKASRSSSSSTVPKDIVQKILEHYKKSTNSRTKLIDVFMLFLIVVGVMQFLYCVLAGNYPFNAFLSGFCATVGQFVLTASLRVQTQEDSMKDFPAVSPERAFADYVVCSLILHFFCVNFIN